MRATRYTLTALLFLILFQASLPGFGQLGFSFNLKKPKEYEDQQLRSERSEEKKFTLVRRFFQNMTTHYNYYFNANNKLNDILERAKLANRDDYSQLLSFYNYSLETTAQDSVQLDSLTYKSSTAIALHDLRNDWVDNMYLLWGASYYLQKKFDSAYLMFQFINYAFSPREKDGTIKVIGSGRDGNTAYSISTKEKNSLPRRIFTEPPSRNDAFIWQIRNFLAQDELAEAASLIVALKEDPKFPKRLRNDLHEVQAYWFYKQNLWDSAATHLVQALSNATNKQEMARWEYLAAQLFEMSGKYKKAEEYYTKVTHHTTDPIMDIYARLFAVRVNKDGGEKTIDKNVNELLKMAKQDRYEEYRDIIYYMAGRMQLEGNNIEAAIGLLKKSTQYTSNDPSQRNRAFLQLAEIAYNRKQYRLASNYYDSLNLSDPGLKNPDELKTRKEILGKLAVRLETIERQDSLQKIAAMAEDERKDFVRKLVKELRKKQGLKGDDPTSSSSSPFNTPPPLLFQPGATKGEWYFYNKDFKARGLAEFKNKWGNRPNADNWRRGAVITAGIPVGQQGMQNPVQQQGIQGSTPELSFDRLYANLPLTESQMKLSRDSIRIALFEAGKLYAQELEDCNAATETLESLRTRFPDFQPMDEVLFYLYFCYNKNGETGKAAAIKQLMAENYKGSDYTTIVTTGKNPKTNGNNEATKAYERVYDLFIEGDFSKAIAEKQAADALYGKNYWTPQLLYIEAVYYIKQRDDSTAKNVLNALINQFPNTPMSDRASNLLNILNRRSEIEEELKNLVVKRNEDTAETKTPDVYWVNTNPQPKDTATKSNPVQPVYKDTSAVKPPVSAYKFVATDAHYVAVVLHKVDLVYANESKNAFTRFNKDTYYNKVMTATLTELDAENRLLLISPFKDATEALDYVVRTRPRAASEITPWLKTGKYSFIIVSDVNLTLLKANKDVETYRGFLNQQFPGKF
jgi:outer membrane protein assembly factor BamD (BamD/ComL family)